MPNQTPRENMGRAIFEFHERHFPDDAQVPWQHVDDTRQEAWMEEADAVIDHIWTTALAPEAIEEVADGLGISTGDAISKVKFMVYTLFGPKPTVQR